MKSIRFKIYTFFVLMYEAISECNDVSINFYPLKYLTTKNKAQSLAKKPFN